MSARRSETASDAARLTAVVVFPTPPFWFAIARTSAMSLRGTSSGQCHAVRAGRKDVFHVELPATPADHDLRWKTAIRRSARENGSR